jgi:hypothetical protein
MRMPRINSALCCSGASVVRLLLIALLERLVAGLMDYFRQEQAIVRAACEIQQRINRLLGRTPPTRPFNASDIDIYNRMDGDVARLPYLVDELEEMLGLRIVVTQDTIEISDRSAVWACDHLFSKFGQHGVGQSTCDGHGVTKGEDHED